VNVYCKPYLLYGAEVINWNNSEISSIRHAFNSAMCKVYKVKFQLLDSIYDFTNQRDIVQDIYHRRRSFDLKLLSSNNLVVKHVGLCAVCCWLILSLQLCVSMYSLIFFSFSCIYLLAHFESPAVCFHVFSHFFFLFLVYICLSVYSATVCSVNKDLYNGN